MNTASPAEVLATDPELPEGWEWAQVREVSESVPNTKPESEPNRIFGYLDISSICNKTFRITDHKRFRGKEAPSRARRPIKPGDVLFSNVRTYLRNIALVPVDSGAQLCSTGFTVLRPNGAIEPKLLFYQVLTDRFIDLVTPQQTGSQYPATSDRVVMSGTLPLPPLEEQKRIIERVEQLLSHVNAARERLTRVPAILKRFRQAVLAAACSGRLTSDLRQKTRLTPNWYEELVNRLRNEGKSAEWHEPDFEIRQQAELPEDWHYIALGNLGDWATGGTPSTGKAVYWDGGTIPWLSPKDMKLEAIGDTQDHITQQAVEETRLRIIPKDSLVFVVRGLILARLFPVAMLSRSLTINQDIRAIIPNEAVFPEYLLRVMQSESLAVLFAVRESTHGTRRLESPTLKRWPIPLPPMEEQKEIARRVDNLFRLAHTIERSVTTGTARAEKLAQAVLAKAFRGKLVPTEAELARRENRSYESASALLTRIRTVSAASSDNGVAPKQGRRRAK